MVTLQSNRSTFNYDLDLSGQIIKILNFNWLILVILSCVCFLTSIYITFKLTFKLLDHFQQCGWIFRLVTFSEVYSSWSSLWGRYYERELSLRKGIPFCINTPPRCFRNPQQLHTNKFEAFFFFKVSPKKLFLSKINALVKN